MTNCWLYAGYITSHGYAKFSGQYLHRVVWENAFNKVLPDSLHIDHLCRNRSCINPAHLEPVTRRENILRGQGIAATGARRKHCIRGHLFSPNNLYHSPKGYRICRACNLANLRKRRS